MRRGLISWSRAELPEAVLDARVAAAQAAMATANLDALVVYTTPSRTAGVAWLTGFVPYWNQGLLVVPGKGRPVLVSALSNRVNGWIKRNAHVADVRNAPRIGAEVSAIVAQTRPKARIGVVDMLHLPSAVVTDMASGGHTLENASDLLAALRAVADPTDLALHFRAAGIAHQALNAIPTGATDAATVIAIVDGTARQLGAEEAYPALALDLQRSHALLRLEGAGPLGQQAAVRLSVAYKGAWVRMTRTLLRDPAHAAHLATAAEKFATAVAALPKTIALAAFQSWLIEGTRTTSPLQPLAGSIIADAVSLFPGSLVNVQATIDVDGIPILVGAPALIGRDGALSSLLRPLDFASP